MFYIWHSNCDECTQPFLNSSHTVFPLISSIQVHIPGPFMSTKPIIELNRNQSSVMLFVIVQLCWIISSGSSKQTFGKDLRKGTNIAETTTNKNVFVCKFACYCTPANSNLWYTSEANSASDTMSPNMWYSNHEQLLRVIFGTKFQDVLLV